MALTANQRIQTLERQVRFLQQRLPVSETTGAALQVAITALEVAVAELVGMIDPGDSDGFMDWGASSKGNAINIFSPNAPHAGYHREQDSVHAGGQILCGTLNDAATILMYRMQNQDATTTGWPGGQGVARIDWVAIDKNGDVIFPNGADSAYAADNSYLYIPNGGDTPAGAWGDRRIQCINELENTVNKPPRDILRVTGENGGEVWATSYNSSGGVVTNTKLFP